MFTVDTRKPHSPIRIVYVAHREEPRGPIHAHELADRPSMAGHSPIPLAVIELTEHSDYSGGDVEASNMRVLAERFPELVRIYGSHGYEALAYDATLGPVPESEELCEVLDGLESYCIVDDDDHSELEMELETAAWEEDGRDDFRKALTSLLDDIDPEHEHEIPGDDEPAPAEVSEMLRNPAKGEPWSSLLNGLWSQGCDELNVNGGSGFEVETGQLVHFYIDDWCAKAGGDKRYPTMRPVHDAVRKLAIATRIA